MQVLIDNNQKKRLLCKVSESRIFAIEFPSDAVLAELYAVVNEVREKLWEELEKQKEATTQKEEAPKEVEPEVVKEPVE